MDASRTASRAPAAPVIDSVYKATIGSLRKEDAFARTTAARKETHRCTQNAMLMDALASISLDRIDEMKAEAAAAAEKAVEDQIENLKKLTPPPVPASLESMATLTAVLDKEEDHRLRGKLIRDFFRGGMDPTAQHNAAMFFQDGLRPYEGLPKVLRPSHFKEGGMRMTNHAAIG